MQKPYLSENRPITTEYSNDIEWLGYDPRPEIRKWRGTSQPEVREPLPGTPALVEIADMSYFQGPAWCILRNRYEFWTHAMDNAPRQDIEEAYRLLPKENIIQAMHEVWPGQVSWTNYCWWTWRLEQDTGTRFSPRKGMEVTGHLIDVAMQRAREEYMRRRGNRE